MATWIVVSGSPSVFDPSDPDHHDRAWDNFVRDPLLRAYRGEWPQRRGEEVAWLIYRPGYELRWADDHRRGADKSTKLAPGATDYMTHLEYRAKQHGWTLGWIRSAGEIWSTINVLTEHSLTRLWYYGHARDDMWLWLQHRSSDHAAVGPDARAVWLQSSIEAKHAKFFEAAPPAYDTNRSTKFFGCNSDKFAKAWATTFKVYAEGAQGRTDYEQILTGAGTGAGCTWLKFAPDGRVLP